jgi:hypothetical protein
MADIANEIMFERLEIGIAMTAKLIEKNKLQLSDYEKLDIATRIANALFIEKNKAFRVDKIDKREEKREERKF